MSNNATRAIVRSPMANLLALDKGQVERAWNLAKHIAGSEMVPAHYRGKPANVFIALSMAAKMGVDEIMFMQKSFPTRDKIGIETQIAVAALNASGLTKGKIRTRMIGKPGTDDYGCVASVTPVDEEEPVEATVTVDIAKRAGWWDRKTRDGSGSASLWPYQTETMLMWRSKMWLVRHFFPEVLMGCYSIDELQDMGEVDGDAFDPSKMSGSDVARNAVEIREVPSDNGDGQDSAPEAAAEDNTELIVEIRDHLECMWPGERAVQTGVAIILWGDHGTSFSKVDRPHLEAGYERLKTITFEDADRIRQLESKDEIRGIIFKDEGEADEG